jgi:hypothetical protein
MSSSDRNLQRRRRALNRDTSRAVLGKADKTIWDTSNGQQRYWVRPIGSSGLPGSPVLKRQGKGVHFRVWAGMPLILGFDESKEQVILGEDSEALQSQGFGGFSANLGDPASRGLIRQEELGNLFCRHKPGVAWTAQVLPGCTIMGTTWIEVATAMDMDLSGSVPSAGNHCYVAVFLKDDSTFTSTTSTPQANTSALNSTDVQECINALGAGNWLALRAFVFDGDEDDFSDGPATAKDMRSPFSVVL